MEKSCHCSYRILPELGLVVSCYCGAISENEIIALKQKILQDQGFKKQYNILDDFTETVFRITQESFFRVLSWLRENHAYERNSAVLTKTPEQVAIITLFNHYRKHILPNKIKVFSTLPAAVRWVDGPEDQVNIIEKVLREMKVEDPVI